ncbi:MAG: radical SAM-modified peptide, FtsH ternary system-associated [Pyrinomonadaceae bacterium]
MSNGQHDGGPRHRFVDHLPDLITVEDYRTPEQKRVRVRITITDEGVEILGDSMYAALLEELLARTGAAEVERMLCG